MDTIVPAIPPMLVRIKHLLCAATIVAVGCTQPVPQVTTADVKRTFSENSELLSRMVEMVEEDKSSRDYGQYVGFYERFPSSPQKRLLEVLRDQGLPLSDVMYDKTHDQLTVHFLVDGWSSMRLVYTNGTEPREILLSCNECPTQLFEPLTDGWFIGIIDDSTKDSDK
jgi:hypothetical protein